ncbi:hypothetical protein BJV82DRAFT_358156 [Fennellomyces sp. T-0311]|nr:hypothetical protein BJV82DRAFT_358156 [Fennellomyces sp. T-0311]
MVNFSSGDAILPTRITCYCRHHNEKVGFCVEFTMKTDKGDTIATGMSPPILITDDHKSTRQKGRKRDRSDYEGSSSTISKSRRLPSSSTAPVTPAASRRGSLSPTEAVSPLLADPAELSILDSAPFSSSLPTPSEERAAFGSNTPFFFPPTSPALNPLDHVNYVAPESLSTPTLERLVPAQGPTYGGVEVTILGSGFYRGLTCLFGEHHAATVYWNPNTLVCVLPPAAHPGPVVVSFKQHSLVLEGQDVPLFTYYDANDQALLELALQVVGLKTTGKLHDAKHIAMRIVQGGDHNPFLLQNSLSGGTNDDEHVISFQQKVIHALDYFHVTAKELIQARLSTGHTLLHLATWIGYDKLASKIIDLCHESIFSTDRNGYTALALAQFAMAEDKRRNRRQVKNIMQCQSLSEDCILRNDIHTKPQEKCKPVTNFHNYSLCWLPLTI